LKVTYFDGGPGALIEKCRSMSREIPVRNALPNLRTGDVVEVRREAEIFATLDENGELDGLPFMPEMLQFCGQRFRVYKLAIKLCDTINWTGMHRMDHAVHLEGLRCDGQTHGGCQAGCLLYWKEAWLRRVDPSAPAIREEAPEDPSPCTRKALLAATHTSLTETDTEKFRCQATELLRAAPRRIPPWEFKQYVLDVRSGNARTVPMLRSLSIAFFNRFQGFSRRHLPARLRIHEGRRFPFIDGKLTKTPDERLNLREGELVEVKGAKEIFETLDVNSNNRGLSFDVEMLKYCGRRARVLRRVERIIDERTGEMIHFKNSCIVLENVTCDGDYHQYCPRSIYPYWREIWLKRVEPSECVG
jgi:hypothetical protein